MGVRAAAVVGGCVLAVAGSAAAAAPAKPHVVDLKGDANGVNGQGYVSGTPDQSTEPVSLASFDVLSVLFRSYGRTVRGSFRPEGFTVTLTLAAAPEPDRAVYRVQSSTPGCAVFWFEHRLSPAQAVAPVPRTALRHDCDEPVDPLAPTLSTIELPPALVSGARITWTVPLKLLPRGVVAGTPLTNLGADTRQHLGAVTAPQFDHAISKERYVIGR